MIDGLEVIVAGRRMVADDICEFDLRPLNGSELPSFGAGSHINIQTPSGRVRTYSLTNDEVQRDRYVIAVKLEVNGRGGSADMHRAATEGQTLLVSKPSNQLEVVSAERFLLIGGGVGITPMMSIMLKLEREQHADFHLVYLSRTRSAAAYLDELVQKFHGRLTTHHSEETTELFDLWPLLAKPGKTHLYYCGPGPLMNAIRLRTIHWPRSQIHYENFSGVDPSGINNQPFRIRHLSTDRVVDVPADKTALDAMRAGGIDVPSSCQTGTCGTCRVRLISGAAEHRDAVLSPAQRDEFFIPCVSRASGTEIVLDT